MFSICSPNFSVYKFDWITRLKFQQPIFSSEKNEEKRLKEEEKRIKEEEKKSKAEEKRKKEEEEKKKKEEKKLKEEQKQAEKRKSAQAFASFFVKSETKGSPGDEDKENAPVESNFQSFEVKPSAFFIR